MGKLSHLEPKAVWENFEKICSIPHPSKKEQKIIAFMKQFGEDLGLKTIVDEVGNVIIKKPATPGYENRKGIILQGHLDMVPQKIAINNTILKKTQLNLLFTAIKLKPMVLHLELIME